MSDRQDTVIHRKVGRNCPFYRNREQKAELLADAAKEAIKEAVVEHGCDPSGLTVSTRYYTGRTEPQTSFGEVTVRR